MSEQDRRAVERMREGFAPPELTPTDVARFDAALDARRHRGSFWLGPVLVAAAALLFALWPAEVTEPAPLVAVAGDAGVAVAAEAIDDALTDDGDYWADEDDEDDEDDALPDEYLALAEVLAPLDEDDPLEMLR